MPNQMMTITSSQRSNLLLNLLLSCSKKNAQLFILLCSLMSFHLAHTAPLEPPSSPARGLSGEWEEARQIWNGVRSLKKQLVDREVSRMRRSDPTPSPPLVSDVNNGLDNVSVPAYVKELYRNISTLHDFEDIDATTIRSLPAMHSGEGDGCGFNFTIGEVSQDEIFRRAELRIHMKQPPGDQVKPVYLQLYHGSQRGTSKIVSPNREGWVVFDVLSDVRQWREANHPHKKIHFYIILYSNIDDFRKRENGKNCHDSPIKFNQPIPPGQNHSDIENTADNQPLLMIYSHDLNIVKFNFSAIIKAANTTKSSSSGQRKHRQTDSNYTNVEQEETVTTEPPPSCRKHNLQIDLATFNIIWHLAQPLQDAIFPPQFDINVCGGNCRRDIPVFAAQHSIILYYLFTRSHQVPDNNSEWGQCCVPVKYDPIETLFSLPEGEVRIVTLKNISVRQCSCLTILKWPENRR